MKQELKTIGIEQILKLSDTVDAYALGNDFILGEASGGNVLVNTRILDILQYPLRFDGYILFFLKKGSFEIDCNLNTYQASVCQPVLPQCRDRVTLSSSSATTSLHLRHLPHKTCNRSRR